ncbi:MAG: NADH-quinone oxidoreductase subunit I [ANME-2 cluster archaeon]|nr:NADH-quinone oxidoreductase subunit I [ANME-2 cluster archaeon]MBC2701662.1 NADH-quinone oxidoreductase subunit I [ANME-2 cluster archaeon]MBC2709213.1 NADH-quinone oxidoreductase subunit I [ANME-2 cluster archaeon]MBC2746460.1 NADH-quinone oxidoreductase subunit I [ANME-2 cluster archaeon]MBC2761823.1 NADH-quinone oxidoreductase subunit I [ANME-2 cluster archaeon]
MVLKNLQITLRTVYTKSVTRLYPEEIMELPDAFRGQQHLDMDKCVGCGICSQMCPNNVIEIVKSGKWYPQFDNGHCMFCGLCVDFCPNGALSMTKHFEMACWTKEETIYSPDQLAAPNKAELEGRTGGYTK